MCGCRHTPLVCAFSPPFACWHLALVRLAEVASPGGARFLLYVQCRTAATHHALRTAAASPQRLHGSVLRVGWFSALSAPPSATLRFLFVRAQASLTPSSLAFCRASGLGCHFASYCCLRLAGPSVPLVSRPVLIVLCCGAAEACAATGWSKLLQANPEEVLPGSEVFGQSAWFLLVLAVGLRLLPSSAWLLASSTGSAASIAVSAGLPVRGSRRTLLVVVVSTHGPFSISSTERCA